MSGIYRVHSVKLEDVEVYSDPFRFWDESQFDTFDEAVAAFDRCSPAYPSIFKQCGPIEDCLAALPLVVFLTFSDMTYARANEDELDWHIDKGIGVIQRKTVYSPESTVKREYQGAL